MTTLIKVLTQYPKHCVGLILLLSVALGVFAKDARPQFNIEGLLPIYEKVGQDYKAMETLFGRDDRRAFVIVQNHQHFDSGALQRLGQLTERLEKLDSVERAESATHVDLVVKSGERLSTTTLQSASPSLRPALMSELQREPHRRAYFSDDMTMALVALTMQSAQPDAKLREAMLSEVQESLRDAEATFGFGFRLAGYPLHRAMLTREIVRDMKATTPLLAVAFLLVLFVILRRPSFVLLTLLAVFLSVLWTAGLAELLGLPLNILVQSVLVVVVVVAISDCIHFMSFFADKGRDFNTRARDTLEELTAPCFYTSLTTAAGFLGLQFSSMPSVRDFGAQVALGVVSAFIITLFCILPLLSFSKGRQPLRGSKHLALRFDRLREFSEKHARVVVALSVVVTLLGGGTAFFVQSDSGFLADLRQDHPIHETNRILESQFRGLISIDVLIKTQKDYPSDDELRELEHFSQALRAHDALHSVASPSDLLVRFDQKLSAQEELSRSTILTSTMLFVPEVMEPFYREGPGTLRVRATLRNGTSKEAMRAFKDIRTLMNDHFSGAAQLTGQGFLSQWINARLVQQFATGFLVGITLVLILLAFFLRGGRWALFSLIPNLLPLSIIVLGMVLLGTDLRMGSALALTVVFGLVVDDTIHFIVAFQKNRSLQKTYASAGKGIFYTSLVLLVSFGTLLFSDFQINVLLGMMVGLASLLALVSDLVVLPAILCLFEPKDADEY